MAVTTECPFGQKHRNLSAIATTAVALTGANSLATDTPANVVAFTDNDANYPNRAGLNGAICTSISAIPRQTVTATTLWIFGSVDGTNWRLRASATMLATAVSATAETTRTILKNPDGTPINESNPLRLAAEERLAGGIGVSWVAGGVVFNLDMVDL
ncbi:MAG TPA: hypothetical protein VIF37_06410 [Methylobacter sp.]|jgi:hypothetical protein